MPAGGSTGATSVGIAAAVDVNVLTTSTVASIDNGLTVTSTSGCSDGPDRQPGQLALGLADGRQSTATGKSTQDSVGAAVSVNVANVTNTATIGTGDTITADGVTVAAGMVLGPDGSPMVNDFSTQGLGVAIGKQRAPASRGRSGSTSSRSIPRLPSAP